MSCFQTLFVVPVTLMFCWGAICHGDEALSFNAASRELGSEIVSPMFQFSSDNQQFAARLELAEELPLAIRVGVEPLGHWNVMGNIWLDPQYAIPASLSVFAPPNKSFAGQLIVPHFQMQAWEGFQDFNLTKPHSAGRLIRIRPGAIRPLERDEVTLPVGEHLLQLSWSHRVNCD